MSVTGDAPCAQVLAALSQDARAGVCRERRDPAGATLSLMFQSQGVGCTRRGDSMLRKSRARAAD